MGGCPSGKHWLPKSAQRTTNEGKPWSLRKLAERESSVVVVVDK